MRLEVWAVQIDLTVLEHTDHVLLGACAHLTPRPLTLSPQVCCVAHFLPLFKSLRAGASLEKPLGAAPLGHSPPSRPGTLSLSSPTSFVVLGVHFLVGRFCHCRM